MVVRMGEQLRLLLLCLALLCLQIALVGAEELPGEPGGEEPEASGDGDEPLEGRRLLRDVIALYSVGKEVPNQDVENPVAQVAELPLNHLGLRVHIFDVLKQDPPPAALVERAYGVVTWFDKSAGLPDWIGPWLRRFHERGNRKLVHLETLPGLGGTPEEQAALESWIEDLGFEWPGVHIEGGARVEVTFHKGESCALEANPRSGAIHHGPSSATGAHEVWVSTRDRLEPDKGSCTPVVTAPWGGIALGPFLLRMGKGLGDRRWFIDPFRYMEEAMALPPRPIPHPAVIFGRRMFVFHVDGDGFESLSAVEPGSFCGSVLRDAVINKYLVPSTISIIVASLTPDLHIKEPTKRMRIARTIFDADWVEATSHGVLHPYDWNKPWGPSPAERSNFGFPGLRGFTYSPAAEVGESLRFIDTRLLPEGKSVVGMLWTGHCVPPASAIRAAEEMNCWNMNGGTYRWDAAHDSVGYVSPWGRTIDGEYQVYAGAANENEFDGFYDRSPGAFWHVTTTIERTGKGRILKPANVYAHFYSAERHLRLKALQRLIEKWAFEERTIPVFGTVYVKSVHGAMSAEVDEIEGGWHLTSWGQCRTARFDDEHRTVDLDRSQNVIGWNRIDGSLYVALGAGDAVIRMAEAPRPRPYLQESNHVLQDVALAERSIRFRSRSPLPRKVVIAGLPSGKPLEVRVGDAVRDMEADEAGRLVISLEPKAPERVEVRVP